MIYRRLDLVNAGHRLASQRIQTRLTAIGGILMNDTALRGSIESGNQSPNLRGVGFLLIGGNFLLKRSQGRADAAVLTRARHGLTRTFGS